MNLIAIVRLARPQQWIKNGFVLMGLLFGYAWNDPELLARALSAFAAFCLLSSSVYAVNDVLDREEDRIHPTKRLRPVATGAVSVPAAISLAAVLAVSGLLIAWNFAGDGAPWVYALYLLINVGYSFGLKHVVILDVFLISAGFMLRILAGTLGIGVAPSHWLLLCGLMLTLFLGFAKRHAELSTLGEESDQHRPVLEHYTRPMLDAFIAASGAITVLAYSLYTVSEETIRLHGTPHLIYTVPFVVYGVFRYLYLLYRRGGGGDAASALMRDRHLLAACAGWLVTTVLLLSWK